MVDSVAWSPDGRSIAALVNRVEALKVDVVLVDAITGQEKVLGNHAWRNISEVAWLPDGKSLLINAQDADGESSNQVWLLSASGGGPRRITNDLSTYAGFSLSPMASRSSACVVSVARGCGSSTPQAESRASYRAERAPTTASTVWPGRPTAVSSTHPRAPAISTSGGWTPMAATGCN